MEKEGKENSVKVVTYNDYLDTLSGWEGSVEGKRREVFRRVYEDNKVIDKHEWRGDIYFIVEA
jgi:hypothetical protein